MKFSSESTADYVQSAHCDKSPLSSCTGNGLQNSGHTHSSNDECSCGYSHFLEYLLWWYLLVGTGWCHDMQKEGTCVDYWQNGSDPREHTACFLQILDAPWFHLPCLLFEPVHQGTLVGQSEVHWYPGENWKVASVTVEPILSGHPCETDKWHLNIKRLKACDNCWPLQPVFRASEFVPHKTTT